MRRLFILLLTAACVLLSQMALAQALTGALIGTVKDAQGGVLPGAVVRISSPALIGGTATLTTNEKGQLRFPALPPGPYGSTSSSRDLRPITKQTSASGWAPPSRDRRF